MIPCAEVHPWAPNCVHMWIRQFFVTGRKGISIYAPLYILSTLVFKKTKISMRDITHRMIPDILRSSLFLGIFGVGFLSSVCNLRKLRGKDFRLNYFISGFLGAFVAVLTEKKGRRSELTTYMLNQASESAFRVAERYGLVKARKNGDIALFVIANAIIMYLYQHERETLRGSANGLVRMVLGKD